LKKPEESYVVVHNDNHDDNDNDNDQGGFIANLEGTNQTTTTTITTMPPISYLEPPHPYEATMKQHSMMLRDMRKGLSKNEKKGRFISDEERWLHKYDALVLFHDRYGHTYVPTVTGQMADDNHHEMLIANNEDTDDYTQNAGNNNNNVNHCQEEESLTLYINDEFMEPYSRMQLGHWVTQQRHYYKFYNGTRMTHQRVEYLNALNFVWDIKEARWQEQYHELKQFRDRFGHTLVRQNTTLGHWIYKQRWYERSVKCQKMVDIREVPESALLRANVPKSALNKDDDNDDDGNNNQSLSSSSSSRGLEVVTNLSNGGRMYQGKIISPLTPARRALLNDIGFIWDHWDYVWELSYADLVDFKNTYGHTRVPPTKYPSLHDWVRKHRAKWRRIHGTTKGVKEGSKDEGNNDRINYKANESDVKVVNGDDSVNRIEKDESTILRPDRILKLDSIGFEWVIQKYTWDDNYNHLIDYKSIYGHVNVPQSYNDPDRHPNLGPWLSTQRVNWRKDRKLRNQEEEEQGGSRKSPPTIGKSKDRIEKLESIGIVWEPAVAKFKQQVLDSLDYQLNTNKVMPRSVKTWVESTRKEYKKYLAGESCALDGSRIQILNDVEFL